MNPCQLLANALAQGALYSLVALALALVLYPMRIFHAALGGIIALAGYGVVMGTAMAGVPLPVVLVAALAICIVFGITLEHGVYRPLFMRRSSTLTVAISSFAVYLVVVNVLSAFFGSQQAVIPGERPLIHASGIALSSAQVTMLGASLIVFFLVLFGMKTKFGRALRAMQDTTELLRACVWNTVWLRTVCIILSSFLSGLAGVLIAYDTGIEPTMGMWVLLNSLVIVVVAGPGAYRGIFAVAFLLGFLQVTFGYIVSPRWQAAVSFTILTAFLLFRPSGIFSSYKRVEEIV